VGDTTILANRSTYVDFTLPYSESGVIMVVRNKKSINMWIFLKPLRWDLWLTILAACIFIGIVLRILEHRNINSSAGPLEPHGQELGLFFWFPVTVLAFPESKTIATHFLIISTLLVLTGMENRRKM
jgi:glutamate receptor, ionotropic, plant